MSVEGVFAARGFLEGIVDLSEVEAEVEVIAEGCFFLRCFASTALRWAMASLHSSPGQDG